MADQNMPASTSPTPPPAQPASQGATVPQGTVPEHGMGNGKAIEPPPPSPKKSSGLGKKILIGLGVILVGAVAALAVYFLVLNPYSSPSEVRVTNITDRSATISWTTNSATPGAVVYGEESTFIPYFSGLNADKAYDDRDVSEAQLDAAEDATDSADLATVDSVKVTKKGKYYVHHVTLTNLEPQKTYHFVVGNGVIFSMSDENFAADDFTAVSTGSFMTYKELDELVLPSPTYGNVISDIDVVSDGVIYMKPRPGSDITPLSGILNENGRWYIDLSSARTAAGEVVTDFDEDEDVSEVLVEGGMYGRSEVVTVPMDSDAPAEDINLNQVELSFNDISSAVSSEATKKKGLVGLAYAAPSSCPESSPCTVSPVNIRSEDDSNVTGYATLDSDADFGSLQEALDWAESNGQESWFTLLSGGRFSVDVEPKHVWQAGEVNNGQAGITETPISASVHLVGELVEEQADMPEIVSYVVNVNPSTTPPPNWPEGFPWTQPSKIFGLAPRLIFKDSASSSVENFYFGRGASRSNIVFMTEQEAQDIENVYSTVKAVNSGVDVKNCRFESHKNTDTSVKVIPTSKDQIEYYRVTAVRMEDSTGTISGNMVTGAWAGGFYSTGSSSDVEIRNNEVSADWFMVWADGGKATIYGNVFQVFDGRGWSECFKANPHADAVEECQKMFGIWPGGKPLWTYPVYGVVLEGLSSVDMQQNTIDGPSTYLKMDNVSNGTVSNNLWIQGYRGVSSVSGSAGVAMDNNLDITYSQKMNSEIDMNACLTEGQGLAIVGGRMNGRTSHLLCLVWPKAGSQVEVKRVGATYANGWEELFMLQGEVGCDTLPMDCIDIGTLTCSTEHNACLRPGEEPTGGPRSLPPGCSLDNLEACKSGSSLGDGESQEPQPTAGNTNWGGSQWQGTRPRDIPVTPPGGGNALLDKVQGVLAGLVGEVFAETIEYTVTDNYVLIPKADGVYDINIPSEGKAEQVLLLEGEEYRFFVDENGNGVLDEGEDLIEIEGLSINLKVDVEQEVARMDVVSGLNFVSFENLPEEIDSCKLVELLDSTSANGVTQLARFESGLFEVSSYQHDSGQPAGGSCFPVVPGRGYVVRALGDDEIAYNGHRLTEPAGVGFDSPGWHLVGVNGAGKVYTASSLIDSIDSVEELDADNVTQWDASKYRYEGLQKEASAGGEMEVYGFDFLIEGGMSYFVRIAEGSAVWTPE